MAHTRIADIDRELLAALEDVTLDALDMATGRCGPELRGMGGICSLKKSGK